MAKNSKKIGLALSGGFTRAAAHIGVIEALKENKIPIDYISGCSSGAIVAAAMAAGNLDNLKKYLLNLSKLGVNGFFKIYLAKRGLIKDEKKEAFLDNFFLKKRFEDLNTNLVLVATDIAKKREVIIDQGVVSQAVRGCITVPGLLPPVKWQGKLLVDGGIFNLIPSRPLYNKGVDYVISVNVSQGPNVVTRATAVFRQYLKEIKVFNKIEDKLVKSNDLDLSTLDVILRSWDLATTEMVKPSFHYYPSDVLIKPGLAKVSRISLGKIEKCIQEGYRAALEVIPKIKKDLRI